MAAADSSVPPPPPAAVPSSSFLHHPTSSAAASTTAPPPSAASVAALPPSATTSGPSATALPPSFSLTAPPSPPPSSHTTTTSIPAQPSPFDNPLSDAARAAKSASQWNGLLRWARGVRLGGGGVSGGWEWGTGMYHVPRDSPEYYSGVERAPIDSSNPAPSHRPTTITSHALDLSDDEGGGGEGGGGGGMQETATGRPRRKAAGRSGYAD